MFIRIIAIIVINITGVCNACIDSLEQDIYIYIILSLNVDSFYNNEAVLR